MKKAILSLFAVPFILAPVAILAQGMASKGATYITDEEVKQVNALPGIDRTIRVVDIGHASRPCRAARPRRPTERASQPVADFPQLGSFVDVRRQG